MLLRRRTARLFTVAAGATLSLGLAVGFMSAGTAEAFNLPDVPEIGFPQVTFDPCLIAPEQCDPGPTVPDGPDDFTDETTPTTVAEPDPETPETPETPEPTGDPVVPTAEPAPIVVAAPHFTG